MADDVRLTDLQVIQRYSIAVRGETADRDELVVALRADLDWLQGTTSRRRAVEDSDAPSARAPRRAASALPPARKPAKATAKRTPAKKAAKPARRGR